MTILEWIWSSRKTKGKGELERDHARPTLLDAMCKREEHRLSRFLRYVLPLSIICIGVVMVLLFLFDG